MSHVELTARQLLARYRDQTRPPPLLLELAAALEELTDAHEALREVAWRISTMAEAALAAPDEGRAPERRAVLLNLVEVWKARDANRVMATVDCNAAWSALAEALSWSAPASPEPEGERTGQRPPGTVCSTCRGDATATCHAATAVTTPVWSRIEAALMAVPWCDDPACGIGTCHVHKLAVEGALRDEFRADAHPKPARRCDECAECAGFNCGLTGLPYPPGPHHCQDWKPRATSERHEQDPTLPGFLNTICPVCGVTATYHRELGGYLCPLPRGPRDGGWGPGDGGCGTVTPWPPAASPDPEPKEKS